MEVSPQKALETYYQLNKYGNARITLEGRGGSLKNLDHSDLYDYYEVESTINIFASFNKQNLFMLHLLERFPNAKLYMKFNASDIEQVEDWISVNRGRIDVIQVIGSYELNWAVKENFNFYFILQHTISREENQSLNFFLNALYDSMVAGLKIVDVILYIDDSYISENMDRDYQDFTRFMRDNLLKSSVSTRNKKFVHNSFITTLSVTLGEAYSFKFMGTSADVQVHISNIGLTEFFFNNLSKIVLRVKDADELNTFITDLRPFIERHKFVSEVELFLNEHKTSLDKIRTINAKQLAILVKSNEFIIMDSLLKNNGKGLYNRAKMMVVGSGAAGKTSVIRSLLGKKFIKKHRSTIVGDNITASIDNNDVNILEWKDLGTGTHVVSSDFIAMGRELVKKDKTSVVNNKVQQSTKRYEHNENLSQLINERSRRKIQKITPQKTRFNLFANLSANFNFKATKTTQIGEYVNQTIKSGRKLSIYDFGGQKVFDVLHHLYLTNAGFVVLVVNLLLFVTQPVKAIQDFEEWLQSLSVYTQNVRVFIVGTRAQSKKVKRSFVDITEKIHTTLLKFDTLDVAKNESLRFFPVDNAVGVKNEPFLVPIKAAITEAFVAENSNLQLPANEEIPLAWMLFMRIINRDFGNVATLNELYQKSVTMGFELEEMKKLVAFFTKAGMIVSFHKRFQNIHSSLGVIIDDVVLKPEWLLKALASFVCDNSLHENEFKRVSEEKNMGKLVLAYTSTGILANALLERVLTLKGSTYREITFIKNVCVKMLIMSRVYSKLPLYTNLAQRHYEAANGFWMVPSMNRNTKVPGLSPNTTQAVAGSILWDDIVPKGLFERCICSLLEQNPGATRLESITTNSATVDYKGAQIRLRYLSSTEYRVEVGTKKLSILRDVKQFLYNVNQEVNSLGFALKINAHINFLKHVNLETERQMPVIPKKLPKMQWDCFLSHTWGENEHTHRRVVDIAGRLKAEKVNVWLDEEQLQDNIVTEMVEGMNGSACFIAFITHDYLVASDNPDSNAGKELHYASKLGNKIMIPVLLDSKFLNPCTWKYAAGLIFGSALYIDFSTQEKVEANIDRLCKRIMDIVERRRDTDQSN